MTLGLPRPYELPGHALIAEPRLKFHPQREEDSDTHTLRGLSRFGPYSRGVVGSVMDPIRIGIIGPPESEHRIKQLLKELEHRHQPRERSRYLVDFNGFSATFGSRVVADGPRLSLSSDLDNVLANDPATGRVKLAEQATGAINAARAVRTEFDVLFFYVPERWESYCWPSENDDFNFHDLVKTHAASVGIPTQVVRETSAFSYRDRCSVMWRLSIALYAKAGGIPWKLLGMDPDTLFVGLGYAVRYGEDHKPQFLTTCSQVFDFDGTGLEFIAYETEDLMVDRAKNPFLSRADMHRVMARSLDLYHHRHGGRPPTRVVVHKKNQFTDSEMDGCFEAFRSVESVELVQIQEDTSWRGIHLDPPKHGSTSKSQPGYACRRGSCMLLSGTEALLWTQGNAKQSTGNDFFKEMKGTPKPLLIRRFAADQSMVHTCRAILSLTKMDWNNDALYDRLPVTITFASDLAVTFKRMPEMSSKPYSFRLFI